MDKKYYIDKNIHFETGDIFKTCDCLHLVFVVLTLGVWIPIWLSMCINNYYERKKLKKQENNT